MNTVNVHEAKSRLSQLLALVESGQEVLIARAGTPVARLSPLEPKHKRRRLGLLGDSVQISEDWDAPLSRAVLDLFQGLETETR